MVWAVIWALSPAWAAPERCYASWTGPADGCAVRGSFQVEGTGKKHGTAEAEARANFAEALSAAQADLQLRSPRLSAEEFTSCAAIPAQVTVNCFPVPELKEPSYCFAVFNAPDCWSGEVLTVEAVGYKANDLARPQMCAAVDDYLVQQNYKDLTIRRSACQAACLANVKVNCPQQ